MDSGDLPEEPLDGGIRFLTLKNPQIVNITAIKDTIPDSPSKMVTLKRNR